MATLDDSDILRVVNRGDKPFRVMYDSKETRLDPGVDSFLPFAAVALWFGDPRSSGSIGSIVNERGLRTFIPDRETEVRRLRVKYDNQMGDENVIVNHPNVEVFTLQGEQITTVLDDPRGDTVTAAATTVTDQSNMMALIARQQASIEALTQMVLGQQQQGGNEQQAEQKEQREPDESGELTPEPTPVPTPEPQPVDDQGNLIPTPEPVPEPPAATIPPPNPPNPAPTTTAGYGDSTPLILPSTPQSGDALPPQDQS